MTKSKAKRLEEYTIQHPKQVLIVTIENSGTEDQIAIFKGFSSSLMRPTAFDPDVPVLPDRANVVTIDIVASPYNPEAPLYILQGLTWERMDTLLSELGI